MTPAERYLELGLRLGKHVDGLVDAYYGPSELQEQVDGMETYEEKDAFLNRFDEEARQIRASIP